MMELVDETEVVASERGSGVIVVPAIGLVLKPGAGEANLAAGRPLEKPGDMEQGRFAGARRANQRDHFAWQEAKRRAPQHVQ